MSTKYRKFLYAELRDDGTGEGGIAYPGETLEDFLLSVDIEPENTTDEEVNAALKECGILTIEFYEC